MPDVEAAVAGTFTSLPSEWNLWSIVRIAAIIILAILISRIILALVGRALKKSRLDAALCKIIRAVIKFIVGVVCILVICETLGIEVTSLQALFSVVALAFSLAIQGVLSNLAGGMVLLWAKPFRPGDFIEVDGIVGTVKETSLMYTKVNTTDNKLVSIPNKIVSEAKVLNFAAEATRRVELTFAASYQSPIEQVKSAVQAALAANGLVLSDPAPVVGVIEFGSSAIRYNVWAWCKGSDYWPCLYSINESIKKALDGAGLEMTYEHINVHMVDKAQ